MIGLLIAIAVVAAAGGAWLVILVLPSLNQSRLADSRVKSEQQLRLIGEAMLAYAADNGGKFPEPDTDWRSLLQRSASLPPGVFDAPGAKPGQASYLLVPGQRRGDPDDADQVLVLENPAVNGGAGGNVLFQDGDVVWLDGKRLKSMIDTVMPTAATARPGRPDGD